MHPLTHLLSKGCLLSFLITVYVICTCRIGHILHAKALIFPQSWDTHTHTRTSETLYQSAPKSNAFISRHHPSSKLALKWWSFIKAATARKNSIAISVLGEELKRRGGFFFFSTVCWLIEDFSQNGLRGGGDRLWWVVRGFILFISVYSQDNDPIFSIIKGVVDRNCYRRTLWGNVF